MPYFDVKTPQLAAALRAKIFSRALANLDDHPHRTVAAANNTDMGVLSVVAFELDNTLVKPKDGRNVSLDETDYEFTSLKVKEQLSRLGRAQRRLDADLQAIVRPRVLPSHLGPQDCDDRDANSAIDSTPQQLQPIFPFLTVFSNALGVEDEKIVTIRNVTGRLHNAMMDAAAGDDDDDSVHEDRREEGEEEELGNQRRRRCGEHNCQRAAVDYIACFAIRSDGCWKPATAMVHKVWKGLVTGTLAVDYDNQIVVVPLSSGTSHPPSNRPPPPTSGPSSDIAFQKGRLESAESLAFAWFNAGSSTALDAPFDYAASVHPQLRYVGGAAGRRGPPLSSPTVAVSVAPLGDGREATTDVAFAFNAGMIFMTPEEFATLGERGQKVLDVQGHVDRLLRNVPASSAFTPRLPAPYALLQHYAVEPSHLTIHGLAERRLHIWNWIAATQQLPQRRPRLRDAADAASGGGGVWDGGLPPPQETPTEGGGGGAAAAAATVPCHPFMVLLMGGPASGKSTFARQIFTDHPTEGHHVSVVNRDTLRSTMTACQQAAARALQQGKSVVVDHTNVTHTHRQLFYDVATAFGVQPVVICIDLPFWLERHLNDLRRHHHHNDTGSPGGGPPPVSVPVPLPVLVECRQRTDFDALSVVDFSSAASCAHVATTSDFWVPCLKVPFAPFFASAADRRLFFSITEGLTAHDFDDF